MDPLNQCADLGATSCSTDGTCNGSGACRLYAAGTPVRGGDVHGDDVHARAHVQRHRHLPDGDVVQLRALRVRAGRLPEHLHGHADCASPNTCSAGSCGLLPPGATCTAPAQCNSGFCEQGTCCLTACTGTCRSCALAGTPGTCTTSPSGDGSAGPVHGRRHGELRHRRHLQRRRRLPAVRRGNQLRRRRACTGSTFTPRARLQRHRHLSDRTTSTCGPFVCGASVCRTNCTVDADCVSPNICVRRRLHEAAQRRHLRRGHRLRERHLRAGHLLRDDVHRDLQVVRARRHAGDMHQHRRRPAPIREPVRRTRAPAAAATTAPATAAGACRLYATGTGAWPRAARARRARPRASATAWASARR